MAAPRVVLIVALVTVALFVSGFGAASAATGNPRVLLVPVGYERPAADVRPLPREAPVTVHTGSNPDAVLVDPTNGTAYVASEYGNNVSVISLATESVVTSIPVGAQPYPGAIALDPINWTVYVANGGSSNVSVISIGEQAVIASVDVGATPDAIVYNSFNHDLYVANGGSSTVSIISPATHLPKVVSTIPVGPDPDGLAVDTTSHDVFVASAGTNNVTVLSGKTNTAIKSIPVGIAPAPYGAIAYDPQDNDVYVANVGSDNVSVIGGTNLTLFATVPVGSNPSGLAVDPTAREVFVANQYSNNVTVFATKNSTRVATVNVGDQPATHGAIAFDEKTGYVVVADSASDNVDTLRATPVAEIGVDATTSVGTAPNAIATDSLTGAVFVADQGSGSVTIFHLAEATFNAAGLPAGSPWSVTAGSPPITASNTTVKSHGTVSLLGPVGSLAITVTPPSGYGLARIAGPGKPTQSAVNLTGTTQTFRLDFAAIGSLTFHETGLPAGSEWGATITSPFHAAGPPGQQETTTTDAVSFSLPRGTYRAIIIGCCSSGQEYTAHPATETVKVGAAPVSKTIVFSLPTAAVEFTETGLPKGTEWQVNVTGPVDQMLTGTKDLIKFLLPAGTYTFQVSNEGTYRATPLTGGFTVVVPHAALKVAVTYTPLAHYTLGLSVSGSSEPSAGTYVDVLALTPSAGLSTAVLGLTAETSSATPVPPEPASGTGCNVGAVDNPASDCTGTAGGWYAVLVSSSSGDIVAIWSGASPGWATVSGSSVTLSASDQLWIVTAVEVAGSGDTLNAYSTSSLATVSGSCEL